MPPQSPERRAETCAGHSLDTTTERTARARSASTEELKVLVHDPDEAVLLALLDNPNLEELHVTQLLDRLALPANILGGIAGKRKWTASEAVRLRLAQHPQTPKRVALAVVRQLFLFDLVRLSLLPSAPGDIRRIAEEIIVSRVPHLPVGEKLTLARRGPARVAGAILAEGHPQATKIVLGNAFLTEAQVLKVLASSRVPEDVVAAVAQHAKWSSRYNVRAALVRNPRTPVPCILAFLPDLTSRDLQDIEGLQELPQHTKKYIQKEIKRRERGKRNEEG
jgi:hypothetical protein